MCPIVVTVNAKGDNLKELARWQHCIYPSAGFMSIVYLIAWRSVEQVYTSLMNHIPAALHDACVKKASHSYVMCTFHSVHLIHYSLKSIAEICLICIWVLWSRICSFVYIYIFFIYEIKILANGWLSSMWHRGGQ